MQAPVYEAGCRGSTPRREAEKFSSMPPSWRNQVRASEARRPGSTPGGGAAAARVVERTRAAFNANTLGKENAMAHKGLFSRAGKAPAADTINEAMGRA